MTNDSWKELSAGVWPALVDRFRGSMFNPRERLHLRRSGNPAQCIGCLFRVQRSSSVGPAPTFSRLKVLELGPFHPLPGSNDRLSRMENVQVISILNCNNHPEGHQQFRVFLSTGTANISRSRINPPFTISIFEVPPLEHIRIRISRPVWFR